MKVVVDAGTSARDWANAPGRPAHPAFDDLLRAAAHGQTKRARADAVVAIAALGEEAIEPLHVALCSSPNENVRLAAARALGALGGAAAVDVLGDGAAWESTRAVRVAVVEALGRTACPAAVDVIGEILVRETDHDIRLACCAALCELRAGGRFLLDALKGETTDYVRARIVHSLGRLADRAASEALRSVLHDDRDTATRRAAVGALVAVAGPDAAMDLAQAALRDDDPKVRARAIGELAGAAPTAAVESLVEALVVDPVASVRAAAADGLASIGDVEAKLDALGRLLLERRLQRPQVDVDCLARALAPDGADDAVSTALVRRAVAAEPSVTPVLAATLVAICDGDSVRAGRHVADVQAHDGLTDAQLRPLRIEVGGETALDPVLRELKRDLGTYFQEPIRRLNDETRANWQATIASARFGFRARNAMSIAVFVVGMALLVASSIRLLSGDVGAQRAWGSGISFAGGLAAIVAAVYARPLQEVRSSVADLGAASAAFIAYIHTVLQVSHVFSAEFLRETVTLDHVERASGLIQSSMQATVKAIQPAAPDDLERIAQLIQSAMVARSSATRQDDPD